MLLNGTSVLAIVAAAALAGCRHDKVIVVPTQTTQAQPSTNTVIVREAPPAPREESMPQNPPSPNKAWAPGHYEYRDNTYVWVEGQWLDKPNAGAEYVSAHWEERDGGWVFVAGHWR